MLIKTNSIKERGRSQLESRKASEGRKKCPGAGELRRTRGKEWTYAGESLGGADRVVRSISEEDRDARGKRGKGRKGRVSAGHVFRLARVAGAWSKGSLRKGKETDSSSTMQASRRADPTERKRLCAWKRNWSLKAGSFLSVVLLQGGTDKRESASLSALWRHV